MTHKLPGPWIVAVALATSLVSARNHPAPTGIKAAQDGVAAPKSASDPEASPKGRRIYMGRKVARTMHWRGADWLMRETRENEENGRQLREWLDVQPGSVVADLGCGNGYHTLPLAAAVGATGKVYGVDLQAEMLEFLAERATSEAARLGTQLNIEPILATIDDPKLPPQSCDFVLMVDVYHELSHPVSVLRAIRAALSEDGVVVLVEFRTEDRSVPIKPDHKMTKAQMIAEMAANGFRLAAETNDLPWQHAMAFEAVSVTDWDARPAPAWDGARPRFQSEVMAQGFLDAVAMDDPRVVAPFLADVVAMDGGLPNSGAAVGIELAEWMRASEAPLIPEGTTFVLEWERSHSVSGLLTPPEGQTIHGDRVSFSLAKNEDGLWLVDSWLPAQ